jgi:hypothetical protein
MTEQPTQNNARKRRLSELIGMQVRFADGDEGREVIDVRLSATGTVTGHLPELAVSGLLVGRVRPGTLFGYDRDPDMGPWMIRTIVRAIHRHTGYLEWSDVEQIDWDAGVVRVRIDKVRDMPAEYASGEHRP